MFAAFVTMIAVLPVRLREIAIENLLLVGSQRASNLLKSLPEQVMALMIEIAPRRRHFESSVAQDVANAIALRRCQIEVAIEALDKPVARHMQITVSIRQGADRETNQKT